MARDDNFELSWLKMFLTRNIVSQILKNMAILTHCRVFNFIPNPFWLKTPLEKWLRGQDLLSDGKICEVDGVASLTEHGYTWRNRTKEV